MPGRDVVEGRPQPAVPLGGELRNVGDLTLDVVPAALVARQQRVVGRSGIGHELAQHDPEQGRLAAGIAADDGGDLARPQLE